MITQLLAVGAAEIILIVACAALVVGVTVAAVIRKKKGKPSCGCDCANCCANCKNGAASKKDK